MKSKKRGEGSRKKETGEGNEKASGEERGVEKKGGTPERSGSLS